MEQWKNGLLDIYRNEIEITDDGLLKNGFPPLCSPQEEEISLEDGRKSNQYVRQQLSWTGRRPEIIEAAKQAYDERGYGLSSVRFICGTTQDIHLQLERSNQQFPWNGRYDTVLLCFDANGGLFRDDPDGGCGHQ